MFLAELVQEYVLMTDFAKSIAADAALTNRSKSANFRDMPSIRKKSSK